MKNATNERDEYTRRVRKIHALKNALALSEDEYRLTLLHNFRVDSSKMLTGGQQEELIKEMESQATERGVWQKYEGKARFESYGKRSGMASPAQLRKIEALWKDASDTRDQKSRAKALRSFLNRHFKIADLRFLDQATTNKVIHTLNHIVRQKKAVAPPTERQSAETF